MKNYCFRILWNTDFLCNYLILYRVVLKSVIPTKVGIHKPVPTSREIPFYKGMTKTEYLEPPYILKNIKTYMFLNEKFLYLNFLVSLINNNFFYSIKFRRLL